MACCCYTEGRAKELGVDMQGFRIGSPDDEKFQESLGKPPHPECKPLDHPRSISAGSTIGPVASLIEKHVPPPQIGDHGIEVGKLRSSRNLRPGHHSAIQAVEKPVRAQIEDAGGVFRVFDEDGDQHLDFYEAVMLAHQLEDHDSKAYPFPFQRQVWDSILRADGDRDAEMNPDEFSRWYPEWTSKFPNR